MTKQTIIMAGASGAGKSTWLREHYPRAFVCSADRYFVTGDVYTFDPRLLPAAHATCLRDYVAAVCRRDAVVAVDNTNTTIAEIAPYVALAQAYGYDVKIVWMRCASAGSDEMAARNLHDVPVTTVVRQRAQMQDTANAWPRHWPRPDMID